MTKSKKSGIGSVKGKILRAAGRLCLETPKKNVFTILTPWYDDATLARYEGQQVIVVGMRTPKADEIAVRTIFALVAPKHSKEADAFLGCAGCDIDMTECGSLLFFEEQKA